MTALMTAAAAGWADAVDRLIRAGARVDAADASRQTALMYAAASGRAPAVRRLLDAGARVDDLNAAGDSALCIATAHAYEAVTSLLIAYRAKLDVVNRMGLSPYGSACAHGDTGALMALLLGGASRAPAAEAVMVAGDREDLRVGLAASEAARGVENPIQAARLPAARRDALRRVPAFAPLSEPELDTVLSLMAAAPVYKGDVLVAQGQPVGAFTYVLEGALAVETTAREANATTDGSGEALPAGRFAIAAGDALPFFGDSSLYCLRPAAATVCCTADAGARVLRLTHTQLSEWIESSQLYAPLLAPAALEARRAVMRAVDVAGDTHSPLEGMRADWDPLWAGAVDAHAARAAAAEAEASAAGAPPRLALASDKRRARVEHIVRTKGVQPRGGAPAAAAPTAPTVPAAAAAAFAGADIIVLDDGTTPPPPPTTTEVASADAAAAAAGSEGSAGAAGGEAASSSDDGEEEEGGGDSGRAAADATDGGAAAAEGGARGGGEDADDDAGGDAAAPDAAGEDAAAGGSARGGRR